MKGMNLAIVLAIAGLVVGAGVGYYLMPTKTVTTTQIVNQVPLKNAVIQLGFISPDDPGIESGKPLHTLMTADENAYLAKLGYGATVKWLVDNCVESDNVHLEKVQSFRSLGITVVEGGGWSSQAGGSLSYMNENHMLLWSWSSTSPTYAIANDCLFRMCPNDFVLAPGLATTMDAWGIKSCIIIVRADSWGDGIVNLFKPVWAGLGHELAGDAIRYDPAAKEFTNYLQIAETQAEGAIAKYGKEHVGAIILSFSEAAILGSQAGDYPSYYSIKTFGGDGTAYNTRMMANSPQNSVDQVYFSLQASAPSTPKWDALKARYEPLSKLQMGPYDAFQYDIGDVIIGSMTQVQSQNAVDIIPVQISYCANMFGVGGWCRLQDTGDRAPPMLSILGYVWNADHNAAVEVIYGYYDGSSNSVAWNMPLLTAHGLTIPGQ